MYAIKIGNITKPVLPIIITETGSGLVTQVTRVSPDSPSYKDILINNGPNIRPNIIITVTDTDLDTVQVGSDSPTYKNILMGTATKPSLPIITTCTDDNIDTSKDAVATDILNSLFRFSSNRDKIVSNHNVPNSTAHSVA